MMTSDVCGFLCLFAFFTAGVVAYAVSAENYGRIPLNQRGANGGTRSGVMADSDGPRRRTHGTAENRMDAFEMNSASNQVPVRQPPPRWRESNAEKEAEINALNPGPPPNIQDESLKKPWHEFRQRASSPPADGGNRFSEKVYFDREQADAPLRHGDGTPEEGPTEPRLMHRHQADPPYAQRVRPDLSLPRMAAAAEHPSRIAYAPTRAPAFAQEGRNPSLAQTPHQRSGPTLKHQQQHPLNQQHPPHHEIHSVESHSPPSSLSRSQYLPAVVSLPVVADGPQSAPSSAPQPPEMRPPPPPPPLQNGSPISPLIFAPQTLAHQTTSQGPGGELVSDAQAA
ncbi:hypothetical protein BIW11_13398, partial [Tropilaelaps mercedesae]